jgi:hypothetical protein
LVRSTEIEPTRVLLEVLDCDSLAKRESEADLGFISRWIRENLFSWPHNTEKRRQVFAECIKTRATKSGRAESVTEEQMGKLILATVLIVGGLLVGRVLVSMAAQIRDAARPRLPLAPIGRAVQAAGCSWVAHHRALELRGGRFRPHRCGHRVRQRREGSALQRLHFVLPYKDVIRMDTRVQKHEADTTPRRSTSRRARGHGAELSADRRPRPEVYRTVGLRYEQSIIDPAAPRC